MAKRRRSRRLENAPSVAELESFLVQFVIDQTGYPPEIVRLDADLEADLGIDSIKKAQLFGELGEYFDVTPSDDLRLDQFPTLRHVLDFLKGAPGKSQWLRRHRAPSRRANARGQCSPAGPYPSASSSVAAPGDMKLAAASTAALLAAAPVAMALGGSATPHTLLAPDRGQRPTATIRAKANAPRIEELEQFLVQFVVDQTGYPPEIVKLDADLEADLGIDSIKKAQLFGELGEYFDVSAPENLRLDEFPTLGHVLRLLRSSAGEQPAPVATAAPPVPPALTELADGPGCGTVGHRISGHRISGHRISGHRISGHRISGRRNAGLQVTGYRIAGYRTVGRRADVGRRLSDSTARHELRSGAAAWRNTSLANPAVAQAVRRKSVESHRAGSGGGSIPPRAGALLFRIRAAGIAGYCGWSRRPSRQSGCPRVELRRCATAPPEQSGSGSEQRPGSAQKIVRNSRQRLVLRMMDAPLEPVSPEARFVPSGAALVLGDNALAGAIAARLSSLGVPVEVVSSSHPWPRVRATIRAALEPAADSPSVSRHGARPGGPTRGRRGGVAAASRARGAHTVLPLSGMADAARGRQALQRLNAGCDNGLGRRFRFLRQPRLQSKGAPPRAWSKVCSSSRATKNGPGSASRSWTFRQKSRSGLPPRPFSKSLPPASPTSKWAIVPAVARWCGRLSNLPGALQPQALPSGTWVVTGGGRGIAAIAALALARRFGLRLHLVGLSPQPDVDPSWRSLSASGLEQLKHSIFRQAHAACRPPHEEWRRVEKALEIDRTLRACAAAGVATTYHSCDVSVWQDLARVLERIRAVDGPIEGVLHGAGIVHDAAFRRKKPAHVRQTFAAKNVAAAALIELTRQDPLRHFVAFGSMSGRLGMTGQADYSSANDLLCKQIDSLRRGRPECRSVAIHWHAWGETGVANRPELQATFASLDIEFMPPAEGVEHLIRELESGVPESEVLLTSAKSCRKQYPLACIASAEELDEAAREECIVRLPTLVEAVSEQRAGERLTAEIRLDPVADPFLSEHLLAGKPLLPFVMGIESVAQAARMLCNADVIQIENVQVHNGLSFPDARPQTVRAAVERLPGGKCGTKLTKEFRDREGRLVDPARLCVAAEVECGKPIMLDAEPAGDPPLGWFPMAYPEDAPIFHGPKFRCLTQVAIQYDGAFGQIVAPAPEELGPAMAKPGWIVPAAALDACLMLCSTFAFFQFGKRFEIPAGLTRLELAHQPRPGETCLVRMYYKGQDARSARYDFRLFGDHGDCLLSAVGYQTTVISGAAR